MAKRQRKQKTDAERAEIEADRIAASERTGVYAEPRVTDEQVDRMSEEEANKLVGISDSAGQNAEQFEVEGEQDEQRRADQVDTNPNSEDQTDGGGTGEGKPVDPSDDEGVEVDEERVPNSIVKPKFKDKYAANAAAIGDTRKQVKRSNWDWLSQQLAAACLSDKGKIEIGAFTDILDANGVDHSRWTNRNKGWEGRFRMTGRVALQKVVANAGVLKTPGGTELEAPADFIERYKTKA